MSWGCIQGTGRLFPLYWTAGGGGEGTLPLKEMEGGDGDGEGRGRGVGGVLNGRGDGEERVREEWEGDP